MAWTKSGTDRANHQWKEYYKDRQKWTKNRPESFLDSMAPMNEFARFLDKLADRIRRDTPFNDWHPIMVIPGSNIIPLGNVDNFDCLLEINSVTRSGVVRFNATLDVGFEYKSETHIQNDIVKLINDGFDAAKVGIKAEIESRRKLMRQYEKLTVRAPDEDGVTSIKCDVTPKFVVT